MANVDPLVIGPHMYFDYCKKGRMKTRTNLRPANSLEAGDLVIFGGRNGGRIYIDTVFAVGASKPWPAKVGQIPAWPDVGVVAERVHYHHRALKEHPEVYDRRVIARSYRSARDGDGQDRFAWVPWSTSPGTPLELRRRTDVWRRFEHHFPTLDNRFTGTNFQAVSVPDAEIQNLFDAFVALAEEQSFRIAAEIRLIDDDEVTYSTMPDGCGPEEDEDEEDEKDAQAPVLAAAAESLERAAANRAAQDESQEWLKQYRIAMLPGEGSSTDTEDKIQTPTKAAYSESEERAKADRADQDESQEWLKRYRLAMPPGAKPRTDTED